MPHWTNIPAARSSAARLKLRVWLVLGTLTTAAALGLFSAAAWMSFDAPVIPDIPRAAQATAHATAVAEAFVAGRTIVMPTAENVELRPKPAEGMSFPGAMPGISNVTWNGVLFQRANDRELENHRFLLIGPETLRQLEVVMQITDAGPVLAAAPSLAPVNVPARPPRRLDWSDRGLIQLDINQTLRDRIAEWAVAYGAGDTEKLRTLARDKEGRLFPALGGLTVTADKVTVTALVPRGSIAVAHVIVPFTQDEYSGTLAFDLLIQDGTTTDPAIVAWGPAGSGERLGEYENAITG
jgi:hypothetical protein